MDCFYYEVYECASQNCERLIERKKYEDEDEVYYSYFEEGDYLTEEEQEYEAEMGE